MAAGDTISGQVRYIREDQHGNREVVAGPYDQDELDQANLEDRLYIVRPGDRRTQAGRISNVDEIPAPQIEYGPNETIRLEHQAASSGEGGDTESIDVDADEFQLKGKLRDLNTGQVKPETLTVSKNDLSTDPTAESCSFVAFFEHEFSDAVAFIPDGFQKAAAVEAS